MNIYFLRHGQTISAGTYTGVSDVKLSAHGVSQICDISNYLKNIEFDICYCSTMLRCRKSFELLGLPLECCYDDALVEINFGSWERRKFADIYMKDRQNMERWFRLKENFTFPGGDNITKFSLRVKNWFNQLQNEQYENVLVVSHGGVIRHAIVQLLGLDIHRAEQLEITEGRVSLVSVDKGYSVLRFLNYIY